MIELKLLVLCYFLFFSLVFMTIITFALIIALVIFMSK